MTRGIFHIPVYGGGGAPPDPGTFCPINGFYDPDDPDSGVIWNPIKPADGWNLIAQFQTNSGNATTFDPVIQATSGQYAWDLGDGTIILNDMSISHTYANGSTKTVKLYGKGICTMTYFSLEADNIVGTLDLSHSAFSSVISWFLSTNPLLTSVVFPSTMTAAINNLQVAACNITGVLDLTVFTSLVNNAAIYINSNANLTGVNFATTITGTMLLLNIYSTGITGTLDLSKFSSWTTGASIQAYSNPNVTGVNFATTITGTFISIRFESCNITGTLDLSKFTSFSTSAQIFVNNNSNLTGVTLASTITGTFSGLRFNNTGLTGTLDLSKFASFTASAEISINNLNITGVTWATTITGTFNTLNIYSTGITGVLDLSKFTSFTAAATVYLNNNNSMTGVNFPASMITGFIRSLRLYSNTSMGYVDLSKLRTGVNSLNWDFKNNSWTAAIINHVLVDIDGISASGFTSRVVNVGGTNADPDTTSGGYNGTAARTSLQGKSFTVTIT